MRSAEPAERAAGSAVEVFAAFLRLGLTSFGGPVAHLGYFRRELVERRGWLDEAAYAERIALCQVLPGPTSSQVGFLLGLDRAGWAGACAAWLGFTAPSALLMLLFAAAAAPLAASAVGAGLLHGLKLAAVAVVAQAVWTMGRSLCTDARRIGIAAIAAGVALWAPAGLAQLAAIAGGGLAGLTLCRANPVAASAAVAAPRVPMEPRGPSRRLGASILAAFALLLAAAVVARGALDPWAAFVRSGALVFGGGHVVLPLLADALVAPGWVRQTDFLAAYGVAQALPGPLFSVAAALGAAGRAPLGGWAAGLAALAAIFLPGLLVAAGSEPFWTALTRGSPARAATAGVNAAVVGLLAAALCAPVATGALLHPSDVLVAAAALALLALARTPPLAAVALCAGAGAALA